MNPLVSTEWLNKNIDIEILDASWHLPNVNEIHLKNLIQYIINSIFFDIDKNSNQN